VNELAITTLITRLSRPHASGGIVIERAAILAAGANGPAIIDWIMAHSGTAETTASTARSRGLHGVRLDGGAVASQKPLRYVLPAQTPPAGIAGTQTRAAGFAATQTPAAGFAATLAGRENQPDAGAQ
jgi:hypothetical protein